MTFFKG